MKTTKNNNSNTNKPDIEIINKASLLNNIILIKDIININTL